MFGLGPTEILFLVGAIALLWFLVVKFTPTRRG